MCWDFKFHFTIFNSNLHFCLILVLLSILQFGGSHISIHYISIHENLPVLCFRVIPVHRVEQLHHLLIRPVGSEHEELKNKLCVQQDEDWEGHIVPNVVPLKVGLQKQVTFDCGSTVEEVDENELVDSPNTQVGHFCLDKQPANARERSSYFEKEPNHCKVVSFTVICYNAASKETKAMVDGQKSVKAMKQNT